MPGLADPIKIILLPVVIRLSVSISFKIIAAAVRELQILIRKVRGHYKSKSFLICVMNCGMWKISVEIIKPVILT
jgi:hypothetical protein